MQKYFVSNKAILVDPQGKILLMILQDGRWDLPGGRMDAGEDMRQGLAREVREETGIVIDASKARPFFVGVYPYKGEPPVPVPSVFYIVEEGEIVRTGTVERRHVGDAMIKASSRTRLGTRKGDNLTDGESAGWLKKQRPGHPPDTCAPSIGEIRISFHRRS